MPGKAIRLTRARRERVEAIINDLVQLLDAFDPDADLEPSLGACENHPTSNIMLDYWGQRRAGGFIGYTRQGSQEHWGAGGLDDREDDGDDREPEASDDAHCNTAVFNGSGNVLAEKQLASLGKRRRTANGNG